MKFILTTLLGLLMTHFSVAQQNKWVGIWEGNLNAGIQTLRLLFFISEPEPGKLHLKMQSPQQSAAQLPADTCFINAANELQMEMEKFKISFKGSLQNDSTLSGVFVQGVSFPLQLKKVEKPAAIAKPKRPQTPRPPFTYISREVSFKNADSSISYGGTLTLPDTLASKKHPALLLISGSGPQDRDETILGHKPFAVIADYLTRQGYAVLRVDDRGVGKTSGNHATATSADFAADAEAAYNFLQNYNGIDAGRVGLVGHSEGGMVAPLLAARRKEVKAIVLLAGPGTKGIDLLTEQNVAIYTSAGMEPAAANAYGKIFKKVLETILRSTDTVKAQSRVQALVSNWKTTDSIKKMFEVDSPANIKKFATTMVKEIYQPWFLYFLQCQPVPVLKKLHCNVLALNGSKDLQVLPHSNLAGIKAALQKSKSKSYLVKELPGLNHLFQTCSTCQLDEYEKLEESFAPAALEEMGQWLRKNL